MNYDDLYIKAYDKLFLQLYRLTGDVELTRDLRHDVYIRMIEKVQGMQFDTEQGFEKWLQCVARNYCIDTFRKNKRSIEVRMNQEVPQTLFKPSPELNAEQDLIQQELVQHAVKGVEGLHKNWQQVYKMHVLDGLKFREIAKITGRSQNAVIGEMRHSRLKLKKEIFN